MEQLAKFVTDEKTGLKYELCGDCYIIAGEGMTEQLKVDNQMNWGGKMNKISVIGKNTFIYCVYSS